MLFSTSNARYIYIIFDIVFRVVVVVEFTTDPRAGIVAMATPYRTDYDICKPYVWIN